MSNVVGLTRFGIETFHRACEDGHLEVVQLLIKMCKELKLDLNSGNEEGQTAFHLACDSGQLEITKVSVLTVMDFLSDAVQIQ